jgi:hypothetical protein
MNIGNYDTLSLLKEQHPTGFILQLHPVHVLSKGGQVLQRMKETKMLIN